MATLTIRNIDDALKERLRVRAALHGRSMEEEVRLILKTTVGGATGPRLWEASRALFADEAGVDLPPPSRGEDRPAPDFET